MNLLIALLPRDINKLQLKLTQVHQIELLFLQDIPQELTIPQDIVHLREVLSMN